MLYALQLCSDYGLLFLRRRPGPLATSDICFQLLVFNPGVYAYGDNDVIDVISSISMPTGFHRHLVGKTLRNVCYPNAT